MQRLLQPTLVLLASSLLTAPAEATITAIGPFTGEHTEHFPSAGSSAVQTLEVFDSTARINNLTDGGSIKLEFSSNLGGDLVRPRSGRMGGQLGISEWFFDLPVERFGGYWENNSGEDDATVEFFDAAGVLLDTLIASIPVNGQTWKWNGWETDEPFSRIQITGNGVINGFIWFEDMQVSYVPEPVTAVLLLTSSVFLCRRRNR